MSGYVNYIEYQYASNKGATRIGDKISSPFGFGDVDTDFTANRVVETVAFDGTNTAFFMWQPVLAREVEGKHPDIRVTDAAGNVLTEGVNYQIVIEDALNNVRVGIKNAEGVAYTYKVGYIYDNVIIPQHDLPMVRAEMKSIALVAKARRISIYYSQIAAFQAKTDYGVDLGDQLAEKAVGELSYEIDTEICNLLAETAKDDAELVWSKTLPVGVS